MGDVTCPTCGEPFEAYYMTHDLIWEVAEEPLAQLYKELLCQGKNPLRDKEVGPQFKEALKEDGWELVGDSVLAFARCPCCPKDMETDKEKAGVRAELAYLLGDDEDGLQVMMEDFDL